MHPKDTLWATYRQNVSAARRVRALTGSGEGGTIVRSYEGSTCKTCGSRQGQKGGQQGTSISATRIFILFRVLKIVQLLVNVQCEWVNQLPVLVT